MVASVRPTIVRTTTVNKFFGADAKACLIDGTSPVLQLVDFTSDNPYDDKIAKAGDVVDSLLQGERDGDETGDDHRLKSASELVVDVSIRASSVPDVTAVPAAHADADAQYAIAWRSTNDPVRVVPIHHASGWRWGAASLPIAPGTPAPRRRARIGGAPSCACCVHAQSTAERGVNRPDDFTARPASQTADDFFGCASARLTKGVHALRPRGNSSATTLSVLNLATLKNDLTRRTHPPADQFQHVLRRGPRFMASASHVFTTQQLMCRKTCGRCNDDAVVVHKTSTTLTAANVTKGGVAVAGQLLQQARRRRVPRSRSAPDRRVIIPGVSWPARPESDVDMWQGAGSPTRAIPPCHNDARTSPP